VLEDRRGPGKWGFCQSVKGKENGTISESVEVGVKREKGTQGLLTEVGAGGGTYWNRIRITRFKGPQRKKKEEEKNCPSGTECP